MGFSRVEDTHFPKNRQIRIADKLVDLSIPKIMGIVNTTPDSFYGKSRKTTEKDLLNTVNQLIEDGADFIDIGGYSTRPNADFVSEIEEIERILEPIKSIKKHFPSVSLSLDTFRGNVAAAGIEHGIDVINDISGFQFDPTLIDVVAKNKVAYILMHCGKTPEEMHKSAQNDALFKEMIYYFSEKIRYILDKGITDVAIDPGFGFGKTMEQNYSLLTDLNLFHILEKPILVGISRKSMIYKKLEITADESLNGTTILNTLAVLKGASILRVHDVKEAKQIIQLLA